MRLLKVRRPLQKVVDENFPVKAKRGGGIIKIEAWEDSCGEIVKYSMAYINQSIILFILMITGVFWDMTTHTDITINIIGERLLRLMIL